MDSDNIILKENGECYRLIYHNDCKTCDNNLELFIEKNYHDNIILPRKNYDGDAGFDLYMPLYDPLWIYEKIEKFPINNTINLHPFKIEPGKRMCIDLGFKVKFSKGWVFKIDEKSGLSRDFGVMTMGTIVDSNYRGNVHCTIYNSSEYPIDIEPGQKVCQALLLKCDTNKHTPLRVKDFTITNDVTERNSGGFGSTGK